MDENTKPSIASKIYASALAGLLIFSTYQIGRVGSEAVVELSRYRQNRKSQNQ